jgi:hypothetical protein
MNRKINTITVLSVLFALAITACFGGNPEAQALEQLPAQPSGGESNGFTAQPSAPSVGSNSDAPTVNIAGGAAVGDSYVNLDTGQVTCYDDRNAIACPGEDEAFYGQDAQYSSNQLTYVDNGDGTITDLNTGLMWVKDPGDKMYYDDAIASAGSFSYAGYTDWRVPTIKELYSLMDFSGMDVNPQASTGGNPFVDTDYFVFEYGNTSAGERIIDSQWVTTSIYEASVMGGQECFFGVNFADGRIKCYPTGNNRMNKLYFLRLVRGGDSYGDNQFVSNGDGTISDLTTGLTWMQGDSGEGMDWGDALNYCESLNLGGEDDWRLPNAKELQYLVDYSRSPDTTNSAAIDPIFSVSSIINEAGQNDFPFYWTSTTHATARGGQSAAYIAFGRALGYFHNTWMDVHGAGAQRSDPKSGDPANYPSYFGPQGDVSRLLNYVRCVRDGVSNQIVTGGTVAPNQGSAQAPTSDQGQGNLGGQGSQGGQSGQGGRPQIDLASAAAQLGVTENALRQALGDPAQGPPDLSAAAAILGVTEQALITALGLPQGGPPPPGGQKP